MPDKTSLELAKKALAELGPFQNGAGCTCDDCREYTIAAALIEQMTPVEATVAPTLLTGAWLCGGCLESVDHQQKFCAKCGVPIAWNPKAPR